MMGRHAKRTTVTRADVGWLIVFATFDQPSSTGAQNFETAIETAQRFERIRAHNRAVAAIVAPGLPIFEYRPVEAALNPPLRDVG